MRGIGWTFNQRRETLVARGVGSRFFGRDKVLAKGRENVPFELREDAFRLGLSADLGERLDGLTAFVADVHHHDWCQDWDVIGGEETRGKAVRDVGGHAKFLLEQKRCTLEELRHLVGEEGLLFGENSPMKEGWRELGLI